MFSLLLLLCWLLWPANTQAQRPRYEKMSALVRQLAYLQQSQPSASAPWQQASARYLPGVCVLVQTHEGTTEPISQCGGRTLAQFGNVLIASVPVRALSALSLQPAVSRIEAGRACTAMMDSTPAHVNALPAYAGTSLPHAFTGKGVVVGVQDIGFDVTHPTFLYPGTDSLKVARLWDMLSSDTVGSPLCVGRDYTTPEAILQYAHSADGLNQTHGTHTAGIAAGGGYNSPYAGMAPGSELCLVSNYTSDDAGDFDSTYLSRFTSATDLLGFKYIFDYADSVHKPCVINYSEGGWPSLAGDDQLYAQVIDSVTGKGHILVASAGNYGATYNYLVKPRGTSAVGLRIYNYSKEAWLTATADKPFSLGFTFYHVNDSVDSLLIPTNSITSTPDSTFHTTVYADADTFQVEVFGYADAVHLGNTAYDIHVKAKRTLGWPARVAINLMGSNAEATLCRLYTTFAKKPGEPWPETVVQSGCVLMPAILPNVIAVGSTGYRQQITNYLGQVRRNADGLNGDRSVYSATGPAPDGRIKPDVMAPGTNIISAYSSYYLARHPDASDIAWDVRHFSYNGRTYAWNSNTGTSMASPVVAGAIALWLEANPTLTPADCISIISKTSTHNAHYTTYPNNEYGYGQINVYAGLLEALNMRAAGISAVNASPAQFRISANGHTVNVMLSQPACTATPLTVYAIDGSTVMRTQVPAGEQSLSFSLPASCHGIYVVCGHKVMVN